VTTFAKDAWRSNHVRLPRLNLKGQTKGKLKVSDLNGDVEQLSTSPGRLVQKHSTVSRRMLGKCIDCRSRTREAARK